MAREAQRLAWRPLWRPLAESEFFRRLERGLGRGGPGLRATGLNDGARALVLALLAAAGRRLLVVLPDEAQLESRRRDLAACLALTGGDPRSLALFPALDADPYDAIAAHPEIVRERVVALDGLLEGTIDLLLVPARALLQPLPAPEQWRGWTSSVAEGGTLQPERFLLEALGLGYRRVDVVGAPGEVSRRGGIVDIFPPSSPEPVRIELFGDTVESLRSFDTDHQRSTGRLEGVRIGPATESPPTEEALTRIKRHLERARRRIGGDERARRRLRDLLERLEEQGGWPGFEALAGVTASRAVELFDYAEGLSVVVDEPEAVDDELARAWSELGRAHEQSGDRALPEPSRLFLEPRAIGDRLAAAALVLEDLPREEPEDEREALELRSRVVRSYAGRLGELAEELRGAEGRTVCVMRAPGSAARLREILAEYGLVTHEAERLVEAPGETAPAGGVFVVIAGLRGGFEFPELALRVLAERDIFGEERRTAERASRGHGAFVSDFRDLEPGGLVVHVDHGVARYQGLDRPKGGSLNRDFLLLEFAGGDRLFVPADRLDLVQRYSGVAGGKPTLDRLGGPSWERVKSRVRKSVRSMARELLELYARRKAAQGHAFAPDTAWQRELEEGFPFELTPDQKRALAETKRDMESERPMDRLLVGDVGFGKTEIAVRAAFKAVMEGTQVALLTPTTVLAAQHFETFRERYAPFPVRVEMLSRFRSAAQTRRVLRDLELGAVDVLIGTHRLLSKDVRFKRLGLLVVDEEQRFGVAHKERLKRLALGVDVLAMTATPIPRTLQMSLAGVRDLSVIETPPPGRLAIQTYLVPFRRNVLAQAVRHELRRNGQVFVVHDRIATLPAVARAVTKMAPDARIAMVHGKMPERRLESEMLRFVRDEADVLVTTTIIENGLDIPRANTIIVNRADRFGLAQLYQLRGRVGRSHEPAYAYFVVPGRQALSAEARMRLRALKEFSELGAGFRLAAADLEIRGAGELLGARQHGHIAALGFDLYCQMLERAVRESRGEPVVERRPVSLHLGVDIKIPQSYLPEAGDRVVIYKRLATAQSDEEVRRLEAETEDRFGHLPAAAARLFDLGRLRLLAEGAGVRSVDLVEEQVQIRFHDQPPLEPVRILEWLEQEGGTLRPSGVIVLPAPRRGSDRIRTVFALLERMLERAALPVGGT